MSDQSMKHPPALWTLFLSEMWERFCYYGMRALLTLFLIESMMKGNTEAFLIYGAYTALVYAAPILGGRLADKYLGYQYAIMLGAVLMSIGEFLIVASTDLLDLDRALRDTLMLIGMGGLIVGNGYFKANISTIVGKLYEDGDPRRDSGFTIFYIGINVGALLATTVVAVVGQKYGFEYGFGLAGLGMLAGLFIFWGGRKKYAHVPNISITEAGRENMVGMERWKTHHHSFPITDSIVLRVDPKEFDPNLSFDRHLYFRGIPIDFRGCERRWRLERPYDCIDHHDGHQHHLLGSL